MRYGRPMKHNRKLAARCDKAESQRLCLWAGTDAERRVFQRRRNAGELVRVFGRCHARTEYWNGLDRVERYRQIVRSLAALHPGWVFCEMTAALFHGLSDSKRHLGLVNIVTTERGHVHDYAGIRHHYVKDAAYEVVDGVRVTPLARTVFDCARKQRLPDGLAVIEAALRARKATKEELTEAFGLLPGRHADAALRALSYGTGGTENGGEAYALGVMLEEGYAMPVLQEEIVCQADLAHVDRVDFAWHTEEGRFIVAELDGRMKYRDPSMYRNGSLPDTIIAEKEREERIRLAADELVRFSFGDAYNRTMLVSKLDKAGVPRPGASASDATPAADGSEARVDDGAP